jgi:hypothetical protein
MKKSILSLEGVEVLSKKQMSYVNGSGYLTGWQCTGNFYSNTIGAPGGDQVTAMECTATYQRTFLGVDWGRPQNLASGQVFACPPGTCG